MRGVAGLRATARGRLATADRVLGAGWPRLRSLLTGSIALGRGGRLAGCVQHGCDFRLLTRSPHRRGRRPETVAQALAPGSTGAGWRRAEPGDLEHLSTTSGRSTPGAAPAAQNTLGSCSMIEDYGIPPERVHVVGTGADYARGRAGATGAGPAPTCGSEAIWGEQGLAGTPGSSFAAVRERVRRPFAPRRTPSPRAARRGDRAWRLALDDTGARHEIGGLLSAATCLALPSHAEPAGTSTRRRSLLAFPRSTPPRAAWAPSWATRASPWRQETGGRSTEAMLALADPHRARELGERARRRAPLFTWRAVGERLLRALAPPGVPLDGLAEFL